MSATYNLLRSFTLVKWWEWDQVNQSGGLALVNKQKG